MNISGYKGFFVKGVRGLKRFRKYYLENIYFLESYNIYYYMEGFRSFLKINV